MTLKSAVRIYFAAGAWNKASTFLLPLSFVRRSCRVSVKILFLAPLSEFMFLGLNWTNQDSSPVTTELRKCCLAWRTHEWSLLSSMRPCRTDLVQIFLFPQCSWRIQRIFSQTLFTWSSINIRVIRRFLARNLQTLELLLNFEQLISAHFLFHLQGSHILFWTFWNKRQHTHTHEINLQVCCRFGNKLDIRSVVFENKKMGSLRTGWLRINWESWNY